MDKSVHFLNGKYVSEADLVVSVRDLGFSRGYAVFDYLITYRNKPFLLERHIDRLFASAKLINLLIPWPKKQVIRWIEATLKANGNKYEKSIKIMISGGISNNMEQNLKPTIAIVVDKIEEAPKDFYKKGISVITVKHNRHNPKAKTNNYLEGVKQTKLAKEKGAIEPIFYDKSQVFEGSNSNIFAVIGKELVTPKSNILVGITREVLLKILELKMPIVIKDFNIKDLLSAKEIFLTNTPKGVVPVTKIDGKKVNDGKVGPISKEAMKQFKSYTLSNKW